MNALNVCFVCGELKLVFGGRMNAFKQDNEIKKNTDCNCLNFFPVLFSPTPVLNL